MNISIIPLSPEYFDSYYDCFDAVAREKKYLSTATAFPYENTMEFLRLCVLQHVPYLLVVDGDRENAVVGWADLQPQEERGNCRLGIGLQQGYRNLGLGTMLIHLLESFALEKNCHKITLEVRSSNARAIHVYEKCGFKFLSCGKSVIHMDDIFDDVLLMEKTVVTP